MRAYHMPSLPEMPLEQLHEQRSGISENVQMKLKVLYALDDNTNFLARSPNSVSVKTARVAIPGQSDLMTLGVVSIKDVMAPVYNSSPELFTDPNWDYSLYVKDVTEEDEPFVGHGLVSKFNQNFDQDEEILIPGRVCENFSAFNRSKTLEIRLKFARVKNQQRAQSQSQNSQQQTQQTQQQQQQSLPQQNGPQSQQQQQRLQSIQPKPTNQHSKTQPQLQQAQYQPRSSAAQIRQQQQQQQSANNKRKQDNSTDTEDEEESHDPFVVPSRVNISTMSSNVPKMNRFVNNNPAPKAVRTQSLPVFENMMKPPENSFPLQNFPVQSIARRIYMADRMNEKFSNNNQLNESGSSPADGVSSQIDVSKRFAPDFMKGSSSNSKKTEPKRKSRKVSTSSKANSSNTKKFSGIPEEHQVYQSCFNCKTLDAKGWKWNESDDLSKRGLLCLTCHTYLKEKNTMRPKRLFAKSTTNTTASNRQKADKPIQIKQYSSSPATSTTPVDPLKININDSKPSTIYQDSSDPLNGFDDIVGSDFDFQFGPLTDIDPLPQQTDPSLMDDKENIPPTQSMKIASKATKQSSFEKMLTKSFSGALPTTGASPGEWMVDLFQNVNAEPTPKDATPKDSPKESPKDITTCNTLPCNEDSPPDGPDSESTSAINSSAANPSSSNPTENNAPKEGPVPSSPFLSMHEAEAEGDSSSPNSMNNQSYWGAVSDQTRISSQHDELPSKNLNDQFINDHESVFQN